MAKPSRHPTLDSLNAIVEHVDAIDSQRQEAHSRLRKDHEALVIRVDANYEYVRSRLELNATKLETLANEMQHVNNAPVNLDKLMFSPRVVGMFIGWLIATIVTVIVSVMSFTSSLRTDTAAQRADQAALRSDIRDIATKMDAQKATADARAALQDTQNTALSRRLDDVTRRLDMAQYEMQNLKDLVSGRKKP